jgi:ATP-dependent RNA helicase DDX19/DBP5
MSSTGETPAQDTPAQETPAPEAESLAQVQVDGAGPPGNGSNLAEPEVELKVEVKLADLQADPNNPLYSAKSFEELKL